MDPNLFHLDWERLCEVLMAVIVLSMVLERSLAVIFESRWWVPFPKLVGCQEIVAVAAAALICFHLDFDAFSMIILTERTNWLGILVTSFLIAGGSKGSVKLFHDILNIKSPAYAKREELWAERKAAKEKPAPAAGKDDDAAGRFDLVATMEAASRAMEHSKDAWNRAILDAEIDPHSKVNPLGTLERRWRVAAAKRAEDSLKEMEETWASLKALAEGGLGQIIPTADFMRALADEWDKSNDDGTTS